MGRVAANYSRVCARHYRPTEKSSATSNTSAFDLLVLPIPSLEDFELLEETVDDYWRDNVWKDGDTNEMEGEEEEANCSAASSAFKCLNFCWPVIYH